MLIWLLSDQNGAKHQAFSYLLNSYLAEFPGSGVKFEVRTKSGLWNAVFAHLRDAERFPFPDLLEIPAKKTDEPRYLIIGIIAKKHWSGIITYPEDKIRIISVRRSRPEEVQLYES